MTKILVIEDGDLLLSNAVQILKTEVEVVSRDIKKQLHININVKKIKN